MKTPGIKKSALVLLSAILMIGKVSSMSLPDSTIKKIDNLFARWNNSNSPGCVMGIVKGDSLIYSKGYGIANMEYTIHNTPLTIYHMASVSKQFTAFSIVRLAREGKLKLDDDIRLYLPWFPDLKEKITIRQLLNHTSGIRDQWQLLAISGTRLDDVITQNQIIKILSNQRDLNFNPGSKHVYSNSGYTLLAEIVKSVSGKSLSKYTDSVIFKPLGMYNTHFHDNYREIVPNRAYSYTRLDRNHFANSILNYSNMGPSSLFTNVEDMSRWIMNFYNHKIGDQQDIEQLAQKGVLNDGKVINYALGITVNTYKGWKQYSHGGGDAGYRTYVSVFPDLKMGFIVFCNLDDTNPADLTYSIANLLINDTTRVSSNQAPKEKDNPTLDTTSIKKYLGNFYSEDGILVKFELEKGKFLAKYEGHPVSLKKLQSDTFSIIELPFIQVIFNRKSNISTAKVLFPEETYELTKASGKTIYTDKELMAYTGTYHCPELDCNYSIILKNHKLMLTNSKYDDEPITIAEENHLFCNNWWMNHLYILRDKNKTIRGFEVNSGRVMHLRFNKTDYKTQAL